MSLREQLRCQKVEDSAARDQALSVLASVYQTEKSWVADLDSFFPASDLGDEDISWFLATRDERPVGVTRVMYAIPLDLYSHYEFDLVDPNLDPEAFVRDHRIAEVGRFAVIPEYRKRILVAAILMRAAATETIERGFTHFITDVFETDPNSPLKFHQRILGFQTVATHSVGELNYLGRRITMLLDLRDAYDRLRKRNNWIFRYITHGWNERLIRRLAPSPVETA